MFAESRCGGIVLCGGLSSRMGTSKALLPFGTESMLARIVRTLRCVVEPIVVVAADGQELPELEPDVRIVRDLNPQRGPLEGICVGLGELGRDTDAGFVTACDVPLLQPSLIAYLLHALDDRDAAVPIEGDLRHPLAGVYRCSVAPIAREMVSGGQLRTASLLDRVRTRFVPLEELRAVDPDLLSFRNVNSPDEYAAALRMLHVG